MRFGLLGPIEVHDGDKVVPVTGAKSRALLAALLFRANRAVSLSSLQAALWGEDPPATAGAALGNHVGRLRRALGPVGAQRLSSTPYGLLLRVEEGELDLQEFAALLDVARDGRARRDWQAVSRHTGQALALWRGRPLSDVPELHTLEADVRHLNQSRLQALEWHYEAELGLGRHAEATPELSRWAARHPLHEALHVHLITALCRSGRQAEALHAFDTIRTALVEELGVDPGPALRTVHQQVLTADPALLRPPAAAPTGLPATATAAMPGPAPVPGAGKPTDTPSGTPSASAPQPVPLPVPAQLPIDATLFTGRQQELHELCDALTDDTHPSRPRVVAVTGMGGVGKSALAVHAAHLLRDRFPDGQLYLDLHGFGTRPPRSPHEALATLLADLHRPEHDLPARALPEHTDDRAAQLRTALADLRVLVVLDNARDSSQVLPLLPGTGHSAVIVTSRASLSDLPAGRHLSLAPMDIEEQRALLTALCGTERLEQDLDGALRLLAACAGLPLALRIAGARLAARPTWSPAALADRIGTDRPGRLAALTAGQLGVRATFTSSYLALHDSDQGTEREAARAFRLLGLCRGHVFTAASAAALLDRTPERAEELLERLVDAYLLQSPAPFSYRFHDLLGDYAAERALSDESAGQREAARLRLYVWYALAVERAGATVYQESQSPPGLDLASPAPLPDFTDEPQVLTWFRQELSNIGEVIRSAGECSRPDVAWRLAVGLFPYMRVYWWTGHWEDHLEQALRIAARHDDRLGRAWLLRMVGVCHGLAHWYDKAIGPLREALVLFDEPDDKAAVHSNLSMAFGGNCQSDQALHHAQAALDLQPHTGNGRRRPAILVSSMADALREAGRYTEAEAHYREALGLWREHGDVGNVAVTLSNLGDALRGLGRREDAFGAFREALDISEQIGNVAHSCDFLIVMARTHVQFGEWHEARARARQAVDVADRHQLGCRLNEAHDVLATIEKAHDREH